MHKKRTVEEFTEPVYLIQDFETAYNHDLFTRFLTMPAGTRNLMNLAKLICGDNPKEAKVKHYTLKIISSCNLWTWRARVWDEVQLQKRMDLLQKESDEDNRRQAKQLRQLSAVLSHPVQSMAKAINNGELNTHGLSYKELFELVVKASPQVINAATFERKMNGEADLTIKAEMNSHNTNKNLSPTTDDVKNMSTVDLERLVAEAIKLGVKVDD